MARARSKGQPIHGWLCLDKPHGMTSTETVNRVRRITGARKGGQSIRLMPSILERKHLGDELDVHQSTRPGFDRQRVFSGRCSFFLNPHTHAMNLAFPLRRVRSDASGARTEIGER